jgi:anti-anti-sigma factor
VFKDSCQVLWAGRQAVVVLPEHIGHVNAGQVSEELLSVINHGADTLIVDMTGTISCDYTGANALLRARQRALSSGTELRLAVTDRIVRRALSLSGLDHMISSYPSLEAAIAAGVPAARDGADAPAITPEVLRGLLDALARAELSLRAALESSRDAAGPRIAEALRHVTDGIREISLAAPCLGTASQHAPPGGTPAASRPQEGTE